MKFDNYFFLSILIINLFIKKVKLDLPVHCLSSKIEGNWILYMGENTHDKDLKCGHKRPDQNLDHYNVDIEKIFKHKYQIIVKLERPDKVLSVKDNNQIGKWTMIYDEGFEIKINNQVFFAFSKYKKEGKFSASNTDTEDTKGYVNICNKTFLGWFHKDDNLNWGCFWAEKIEDSKFKKFNLEKINYKNIFKFNKIPSESLSDIKNNKINKNLIKNNEEKNNKLGSNDLIILKNNFIKNKEFKKKTETKKNENLTENTTDNPYVDFVKSLKSDNSKTSKLNDIPHLDIYFISKDNDNEENDKEGNFLEVNSSTKLFQPDFNYVNKVNNPKNGYLWTAKIHDDFTGKSYSQMRNLLGNVNFLKSSIFEDVDNKNYQSNEKIKQKSSIKIESENLFESSSFLEIETKLTNVLNLKSSNNEKESNENTDDSKFNSESFNDLENEIEIISPVNSEQENKLNTKFGKLPSQFDWRDIDGTNYDSPVRKQGECGSCYAIAATSVIESRIRIKSNNRMKPILSPSSVLSCSRYNQGCSGGYPYLVGKFGKEFGFVEESCQPYVEKDDKCFDYCFHQKTWKVKNYGYVGGYYGGCDEESMMREIYEYGPIVVALNATPELYYYSKGIFHSEAKKIEGNTEKNVKPWEYTNHAVTCIGWGEEEINDKMVKYWILKNSWGDTWGDKGYFKMNKGSNMASIEAQGVFINPDLD